MSDTETADTPKQSSPSITRLTVHTALLPIYMGVVASYLFGQYLVELLR